MPSEEPHDTNSESSSNSDPRRNSHSRGDSKPNYDSIPEDPRDKAMIEAFIAGDMAGFKFVYTKYRQRILSYCIYYMGSEPLAEDAFQEVFSRAYTRRAQLRESKALKSWLLLITRSVCLNMLRTSKFTPEFVSIDKMMDTDSESHREPKELSTMPVEQLLADDMLKTAMAKLAPMYRDAFLLREFEGYEYEEIAVMTNTSVMNVKVRITRAKKRLRILLAPYYSRQSVRTSSASAIGEQESGDDMEMDANRNGSHLRSHVDTQEVFAS